MESSFWQADISRVWRLTFAQVLWTVDQRFRNGSTTFLKRLGVAMVSPFFSLYRAFRWVALSPLTPMSLGL